MIDLRKHFKHLHWRPMPHSFGVPVASDWADKPEDDPVFGLYKRCGLWTMDEANLLYKCAKLVGPRSALDIGAHTGWTTAHMAAAGMSVVAVDPMLRVQGFQQRFEKNMEFVWGSVCYVSYLTSNDYFFNLDLCLPGNGLRDRVKFDLVCIDGDHSPGYPLQDAINAAAHLTQTCVILLHDFIGQPVREAVVWLMDHGFKARVYLSAHCVAACWRGDFVPPDFTPDPLVLAQDLPARMPDFPFERCC